MSELLDLGMVLYFALFFLFVAVPLAYYLTWDAGLDAGLATLIAFFASLAAATIFYHLFISRTRSRRLRRI